MDQDKKQIQGIDESMPYMLMDEEDERHILAEMRGEVIATFVYSYKDKKTGREITGLSKTGVDNVCLEAAKRA